MQSAANFMTNIHKMPTSGTQTHASLNTECNRQLSASNFIDSIAFLTLDQSRANKLLPKFLITEQMKTYQKQQQQQQQQQNTHTHTQKKKKKTKNDNNKIKTNKKKERKRNTQKQPVTMFRFLQTPYVIHFIHVITVQSATKRRIRYFSLTRLLRPLQDHHRRRRRHHRRRRRHRHHHHRHHQDRDKTLTLVPKETPSTLAKNLEAEHNTIL